MKIVVAPDSFKGSLSAVEAADAIENGIRQACPQAEVIKIPMADGGEGTLEILVNFTGGKKVTTVVKDPLNRDIKASYGILGDGTTAVIEMAAASGLMLLKENERNPLLTTTYGTGQLIVHALNNNCRNFILGIGGSATNDGGAGMAEALGVRFLNNKGVSIGSGGVSLGDLSVIDISGIDKRIYECNFQVACDVDNPLYGTKGASYVYARQKGGTIDMIKLLDENLRHYGACIKEYLGKSVDDIPGAGAAGGLGGGLAAFLNASLIRGTEIIINKLKLEEKLKDADLIFTGEGMTDEQTANGKAAMGIAALAKKYNIPVIIISGGISDDDERLYSIGFDSMFSIIDKPMDLNHAIENGQELLVRAAKRIMNAIMVGYSMGGRI